MGATTWEIGRRRHRDASERDVVVAAGLNHLVIGQGVLSSSEILYDLGVLQNRRFWWYDHLWIFQDLGEVVELAMGHKSSTPLIPVFLPSREVGKSF